MNETCSNQSELFNLTTPTPINPQKFYFDGVAVSIFGLLGLFGNYHVTATTTILMSSSLLMSSLLSPLQTPIDTTTYFTVLIVTISTTTTRECVDPGSSLKTRTKVRRQLLFTGLFRNFSQQRGGDGGWGGFPILKTSFILKVALKSP